MAPLQIFKLARNVSILHNVSRDVHTFYPTKVGKFKLNAASNQQYYFISVYYKIRFMLARGLP